MRVAATAVLLAVGAVFMALSAIGILRMPDLFTRMHAATKLPTLGIGCVFLAVALHFGTLGVVVRAILGIVFFYLTAPIGAHMMGRAAYLARVPLWHGTVVDELRGRYDTKRGRLEAPAATGDSPDASSRPGRPDGA